MNVIQRILHRRFFIRLLNWEFWSFSAVYTIVYPVWLYCSIRNRSFFFFSAANPRIYTGGFLNESKKDIAPLIPEHLQPKTVFFSHPAGADEVVNALKEKGVSFPLIGKPDVGGRGRGVKTLKDEEAVRQYVATTSMDFHIQEFVSYKKEAGIFYHRLPGASRGKFSGIVRKEFLSVTGDGVRTIGQLLQKSKRAIMYLDSLQRMLGDDVHKILPAGERRVVSPYGNHARGSLFLDDSHLIDEEFTASMDAVCQQIPDFHYGRLDIRFDNWEDLKRGRKFSILEVNGAGAEPTHIYDPRHSVFFAWKEIARHWLILSRISRLNHRNGHPYLTTKEGLQMFREDKEWSRKLAAMPE